MSDAARRRILVTNDDGIDSEGLHVLARAAGVLGDVIVVAPDSEYSGASAAVGALHLIQPEVHEAAIAGVSEAWAVTGPPALCVFFARLGAFGPRFDMVISGINPGANVGRAVYHSGTVGAALTARVGGLSAVAVSQAVTNDEVEGQGGDEGLADQQWGSAAAVAVSVAGGLLDRPPAKPAVINVNVPNLPLEALKGWRQTALGTAPGRAMESVRLEARPGHPGTYRVRMNWGERTRLPAGTDGGAVERGEVSICALSPLTHEPMDNSEGGTQYLDQLLGRAAVR
jgi:5'-nucleotidase